MHLFRILLSVLVASTCIAQAAASHLFVSNYNGDNVLRYDTVTGAQTGALTGGSLDGTLASTMGSDGLLYVASEINNSVQRFNPNTLAYVDTIISGAGLNAPTSVAFLGSRTLVANFEGDSVASYSSTGAFLGNFVSPASGGLDGPDVGMTVGPDGNLYVPSFWNHKVLKYSGTDGSFLGEFIPAGLGGLTQPRTLVFRNDGFLYLTSDSGNKVLRYTWGGDFVDTFVTAGSGGLSGASGLAFDGNSMFVSSWRNNRVLRYDATTGAFQGIFATVGLNGPVALTVVPEPTSMAVVAAGLAYLARRRKIARKV